MTPSAEIIALRKSLGQAKIHLMNRYSVIFPVPAASHSPAITLGCILTSCLLFIGCDADNKSNQTSPADLSADESLESNGSKKPIESVAKSLQEIGKQQANDQEELAFLEHRMDQMETALVDGFKNAADSRQPVQELERQMAELKTIDALLKGPEKCAYSKSLDALGEQLNRKQDEFDEKCKSSTSGKSSYFAMLKEIRAMQAKLTEVRRRVEVLRVDSERLAGRTSEWIGIYRDSVAFLGESEARKKLKELLREDPLTARQFTMPLPAASTPATKRQNAQPAEARKSKPALTPPLHQSDARNKDAGLQMPKIITWADRLNAPMEGERCPETRLRRLEPAYAEKLSKSELRYAINEMYARHGALFPQKELSALFANKKWYRPRPGVSFDEIERSKFSEIERFNLKVLVDARDLKNTGKAAAKPAMMAIPGDRQPWKRDFQTINEEEQSFRPPIVGPRLQTTPAQKLGRRAVIDDQDGWSNIRQIPSGNSPIIRRIVKNEAFYVIGTNGTWCRVVTGNDEYGWVHNSVIKFTE